MAGLKVEMWPIERCIPYCRNPRKNEHAVPKMASLIKEFGFKVPVVARSDGSVVDGHLRLMAARHLGMETVPVVLADEWTEAQVKAFRIAVNKSAELADWDLDLLRIEVEELKELDFDLELTGFELPELEDIMGAGEDGGTEGQTDPDAVPEAQEKPVSRLGDVWLLGRHRLMCGDSTDAGSVALLMNGEKADMVFTDPPYGVSIGDKNKALNSVQPSGRCCENIANDTLSPDELYKVLVQAFSVCKDNCKPDASYYVTAPQGGGLGMMMMMMKDAGLESRHTLMWLKDAPTFSMGRLDCDYKHEPIMYTWTKSHHFYGKGQHTKSVWEIPKPRKCDLHPTMKPVALVENALLNSTKKDDVVLDIFGGSGTTAIAAEGLGRRARLMELSPRYVDVIVRRWQEFTGQEATLEEDGRTFAQVKEERGG